MKNIIKLLIFFNSFFLFYSCATENEEALRIALSKGSGSESYENYSKWLEAYNYKKVEFFDLHKYDYKEADSILRTCSALLLTGGPDVHPGRFNKENDTSRCSIDLVRDTLEFNSFHTAIEQKMPILGICRGLQLINVALGGDLIIDIPDDTQSKIVHQQETGDSFHEIILDENSYLFNLVKKSKGNVNSNHHQGINNLAEELKLNAKTKDNIIEGIEWENNNNKSWLLAVQWHPERLDIHSPFSGPIAMEFLKATNKYKTNKGVN